MRSIIVNYWTDPYRDTPINTAVFRIAIGLYLIWKIRSYNWAALSEWPVHRTNRYDYLVTEASFELLQIESWVVVALSIVFILGYRIQLTSFLLGTGVAHLGLHRNLLNQTGGTQALFITVLFLVLFSLFPDTDKLSIDGLRSTRNLSLQELNGHLKSETSSTYKAPILKWSLITMGIVYFGSSIGKVIKGPLWVWIQPDTISRFIVHREEMYGASRPIGHFIASSPLLSIASAVGTIILELGFLLAILVGLPLFPFVLGLISMHVVIAVSIGPFFLDQMIFLLLFLPWDSLLSRLSPTDQMTIIYDKHCYFCARSLWIFKLLDVNNVVEFHTQYTAPRYYQSMEDVNFDDEMYAAKDGELQGGYDAFQQLFDNIVVCKPIALLMKLPPVALIGEKFYKYIADNRDRYFVCSLDGTEQD